MDDPIVSRISLTRLFIANLSFGLLATEMAHNIWVKSIASPLIPAQEIVRIIPRRKKLLP